MIFSVGLAAVELVEQVGSERTPTKIENSYVERRILYPQDEKQRPGGL